MADKKRADSICMENTCESRKNRVGDKIVYSGAPSGNLVDHSECQGSGADGPSSDSGHKKKPTSFQITSVTVQGSRLSNDGGDDSADDLDESHTEDLSSEFLDCSKTTDLDNDQLSEDNSNANVDELPMWSPPSLPNSHPDIGVSLSLGIDVPAEFRSVGIAPSVVSSGVTLMTTNTASVVNTQMPMVNPLPEHWQHRFKVVKLVSSEPFKRGRWLCMDFTDPPPMQPEAKIETAEHGGGSNTSSTGSSGSVIPHDSSVGNTLAHVYEIPISQSYPGGISVAAGSQQPLYGLILPMHVRGIPEPQVAMMQPIGFHSAQMPSETFSPQPQQHQTVQPQPLKPASPPTQQVTQSTHVPSSNAVPCSQTELTASTQTNHQTMCVPISQPLPDAGQSSATTSVPPPPPPSSQQTTTNPEPSFKGASQQATGPVELKISSLNPAVSAELMAEVVSTHLKSTLDSEGSESSSGGSSTVAIDNKIEQAMDLVKSHLMFAVREEVDVLKEKITELMDRISQLEHENGVLRASASPETLSKLTQSTQQQSPPQPPVPPSQSTQVPPTVTPLAIPSQQHVQTTLVNAQSQTIQMPSQQLSA